jgi:hypothetical protein
VVHLCAVLLNEGLRRHVHRGSRQLKSVVLHRVGLLCVVHGRGIHLHVVLHRVGQLCEVHGHGIHLHEVLMNVLKCEDHGRGIHLRGIHLRAVRLHVGQNYEE